MNVISASDFEQLKTKLSKSLKGFENGIPETDFPHRQWGHRPEPKLFPVPEFVLFALRNIMGFRWEGVGEKVRWSVYAKVDGEPFAFELRKFGFYISHREGVPRALLQRVEGQLSGSLRCLEPILSEVAKSQITQGNLSIVNRMAVFDNRYRYFRDLADQAFTPATQDPPPSDEFADHPVLANMSAKLNHYLAKEQEGYFASGAMVDAYFSRLEHRVLLLRAFMGRPLAIGDFKSFLEKGWDERLQDVVGSDVDRQWPKLLGKLRDVKSKIRNPLAHGGVENDGGAFYFYLPTVGAIPGNLSRHSGRLQTSFFPISDLTHAETCSLFDSIDAFLAEGAFKLPNEFVQWGIDPQFDKEAVASYATAIEAGADAVEDLIDRLSSAWERHANMDY